MSQFQYTREKSYADDRKADDETAKKMDLLGKKVVIIQSSLIR